MDKQTESQKLDAANKKASRAAKIAERDARYLRTFTGRSGGPEVLLDLQEKFPHWRPRFGPDVVEEKHSDPLIQAAIIEGEQNVMRWIEERMIAARSHTNPK